MNKTNFNISLTGSGGRVAGALYPDLVEHYREVIGVSRIHGAGTLSYDTWFQPDVFNQQDVILHLAWSSVPKISEQLIGHEWTSDLVLLGNIVRAIQQMSGEKPHLIFFSSAGTVYGGGSEKLDEDMTPNPLCMYGWSKLHAEQLIVQAATRIGFDYSILRISNLYGVGSRDNDQQGIMPYLIKAALGGSEFQIWGDGEASKDYLHYLDFIVALRYIIDNKVTGLYNISSGNNYSINQLISIVESLSGKTIKTKNIEHPAWDRSCPTIDHSRFGKISHWKPQVDITEGISRMIDKFKLTLRH